MKKHDSICSGFEPDYIPGTGLQVQLLNLRHIRTHHHENALEMLYCLEGTVRGHIAHDFLTLSGGDLVTFDRDDVHNIFADRDNLCLIIHIDLEHPDYTREELYDTLYSCTTHPKFIRYPEEVEKICDILLAAAFAAASDGEKRTDTCLRIRRNLVDLLQRHFRWFSIEDDPAEGLHKYTERLDRILGYVMNHYQEKITLKQLSETLYLNPSYISSFMRRTTFGSLTDTVNYYRCFYAEKLLLETDLPVGEISDLVGFSSEKYFYKTFKSWWNITPLQHRMHYARYAAQKEEYYEYSPSETKLIIRDLIMDRLVSRFSRQD